MIYDGKKDDIISQYVKFTKVFNEQIKKYGYTEWVVRETIRICRDRNVLKIYLESRESEAADIMVTLFGDEEIMDMHVKSERREAAIRTTVEEGQDYGASRQAVLEKLRRKYELSEMEAESLLSIMTLPENFKNCRVEVIILPVEETEIVQLLNKNQIKILIQIKKH